MVAITIQEEWSWPLMGNGAQYVVWPGMIKLPVYFADLSILHMVCLNFKTIWHSTSFSIWHIILKQTWETQASVVFVMTSFFNRYWIVLFHIFANVSLCTQVLLLPTQTLDKALDPYGWMESFATVQKPASTSAHMQVSTKASTKDSLFATPMIMMLQYSAIRMVSAK